MNLHQKHFYFGKIAPEYQEDELVVGWGDPTMEYRFRIDEVNEVVWLENIVGNKLPIQFEYLYHAVGTLQQVQQVLLSSLIGAPNPFPQNKDVAG